MKIHSGLLLHLATASLLALLRFRRHHQRCLKRACHGPAERLEDMLTVVVTTSPSPVHPSLELIHALLESVSRFAPDLAPCRFIIVCDGYKPAKKNAFRSGKVDPAAIAAYNEYKENLHALVEQLRAGVSSPDGNGVPADDLMRTSPPQLSSRFPGIEVLELSENYGFGFAVRRALAEVTTPLVCVIQVIAS